jgi:tetratricopeptide (TPR) repeat protein
MEPAPKAASDKPAEGAKSSAGWRANLLLLFISCVVAAALGELALRLFFQESFYVFDDEKCLLYRYDKTLGWFPIPNTTNQFTASRTITAAHNSMGFRERELVRSSKPRVLVIGDSFVWGYDVEAHERFTEALQARHPELDIYNAGVSGYGTDQEFLLLQQCFTNFQPAIVLLVFCSQTDTDDNRSNARYGGYYKPYFGIANGNPELRGVPVPRGEKAFYAEHRLISKSYLVRLATRVYYRFKALPVIQIPDPTAELLLALKHFVVQGGTILGVGIETENPPLEKFLTQLNIPWVGLPVPDIGPYRYHSFGGHWTPEGQALVTEKIDPLLTKLAQASEADRKGFAADGNLTESLAQFHTAIAPFEGEQTGSKSAIEKYRAALQLVPDYPAALNNLAWILATDTDASCRNGTEAVRLAERACELTRHESARMYGTLGAAYAESGQFTNAISACEKAIALADATSEPELVKINRNLVQLYRLGQPYHQPVKDK